jgi:hypothetical protein
LETLEHRFTPDSSPGIQPGSLLAVFPSSTPFGSGQPSDTSAQVTGLYQLLLNRTPDDAGLAFWTNQVRNTGSLAQSAAFFLASPEYTNLLINADYRYVLGRAPDAPGLAYWTSWLHDHPDGRSLAVQLRRRPSIRALSRIPMTTCSRSI